ncbi:MAG: hypothetical protein B6230_06820 [Desulfobacteraceae bacterium 4572_89]|nr:MAG: hypothetical protein B6230_06820 [Desulfobacteraceae bacterium 4572_89]
MKDKIRVLMVDDEERLHKTTARLLTRRGFKTTVVANGKAALETITNTPHDVVILDLKIKDMNGMDALEKIKHIAPEIQVIMLTDRTTPSSTIKLLAQKTCDHMKKPCDINVLSKKIKTAHAAGYGLCPGTPITAKEIMIHINDYIQISEEATVREAIQGLILACRTVLTSSRLLEPGHRSLLVLGKANRPTGFISFLDLLTATETNHRLSTKNATGNHPVSWDDLFSFQIKNLADKRVKEIISNQVPLINGNASLMEIADFMYNRRLPRIIVMMDHKAVGVIREQDLLFEMARLVL